MDIAENQSLSICYCPPYLPTKHRRSYLLQHYQFLCSCPLCSGEKPDKARAFRCVCGHLMFALSEGDAPSLWRCESQCGAVATQQDVDKIDQVEAALGSVLEYLNSFDEDEPEEREEEQEENEEDEEEGGNNSPPTIASRPNSKKLTRSAELDQAFYSAMALCLYVCDHAHSQAEEEQLDAEDAEELRQEDVEMKRENEEEKERMEDVSVLARVRSKTQQKNAKRRAKARGSSQLSRVRAMDIDSDWLTRLVPSHYLIHSLMDSLITSCILDRKTAHITQCLAMCAVKEQSVVSVLGAHHWMRGVECSQEAELRMIDGDIKRAVLRHQKCLAINERCFGQQSTAYRAVLERLNEAAEEQDNE